MVLTGLHDGRGERRLAELFSKAYAFKPNTTLEVGTEMPGGLRLDTVEFVVPADERVEGSVFSGPKVKVGISNLGDKSVKIGVAIAVTDADGKLVGVASGGTKLFPMRCRSRDRLLADDRRGQIRDRERHGVPHQRRARCPELEHPVLEQPRSRSQSGLSFER